MMKLIPLLSLLALPHEVVAFGVGSQTSRNEFMKQALSGVASVGVGSMIVSQPANAVIGSEKCAMGEGSGCASLAGDNEYIKELQRKSAEKREATLKENQTAYAVKNYPDFFASLNPPKYMVKKSDGSFDLYDDVELAELKKANRIRVEQPMTMGGRVVDMTQKPILVLKD